MQHKTRRLLLSAITLFSLASCSPAEPTTSESKPVDDTSISPRVSEDETNTESKKSTDGSVHEPITIMNAQRDYRSLIKLVNEKYPEINVEVVPYRGRNMSAYAKQQLETGSMPDIYSTTQAWDDEYQAENLLDLTDYKVTNLYNTARLNEYAIDGKVYLLPFDYSITGIAYNQSLFERENIDLPTSFTELKEETIPALKAKGINTSVCLLNLPGSAFNFFFNVSGTVYLNTKNGRKWRSDFSSVDTNVFASDNENLTKCASYFQEWIDCGMINFEEGVSTSQSAVEAKFQEGKTAFMLGTIGRYTQNTDGTGDQYSLMPWLSKEGDNNIYITQPARLYGLSKKLGEKGNEQKLQDALHFLEVLSSNEGYACINGSTSSNLCSIKDFIQPEATKYYASAIKAASKGKAMDLVYTGWDDYLKPYGDEVLSWVKKDEGKTGTTTLAYLDELKKGFQKNGKTYYAEVTEELDTVQAAQLTGQIFMDKVSDAAGALVSYNVYNPDISPNLENSYGANGHILKGKMTEEYITIWLATGWSETIQTVNFKGSKLKEMAKQGTDTRKTGFYYPYVYMTKDGKDLEDEKEYKFILVGHNRAERETMGLVDTKIVGLDAAKEYLLKKQTISAATLDNSLVLSTTKSA